MINNLEKSAAKIGAITTLIGSFCMLSGAIVLAVSGADLDVSLQSNDIISYLSQARIAKSLLVTNLTLWIMGVILIGIGATMMTYLSREKQVHSLLARYTYWIAVPIVAIAYMAWMVLVVKLTVPSPDTVSSFAETIGWFASRADWLATVLVLGVGPFLLSYSGRQFWTPKWLHNWSYFCLIAGGLNIVAMYLDGLTTYGFIIIPVGMGWMIGAGVVLIKKSENVQISVSNNIFDT